MFYLTRTTLLISLLMIRSAAFAQPSAFTDSLKEAIKNANVQFLIQNIEPSTVDLPLASDEPSPLIYAIQKGQNKVVHFLIKDKQADPNHRYKNKTPLMYAVERKNNKTIRLLIENGARINDLDSAGNHALILAGKNLTPQIIHYMFRHGAWLNHRNKSGYTAYDVAVLENNKRTAAKLSNIFENHLPNYSDGPYIEYLSKRRLKVTHLKYDSLKKIYSKLDHITPIEQLNASNPFQINETFTRDISTYNQVNKILIIGDIHGQCDTLKKFLIANHITDSALNWTFGNGHVVFLGDMVDRGEKVTETLWLIYRLEQSAKINGGQVDVLLGNHELMVMNGSSHYTANKYQYLCKGTTIQYQKLFSNKTVLGRWLRSKNVVMKINDNLFAHAGYHPDLIKQNLSLDSINILFHNFLNQSRKKEKTSTTMHFLLGENGPLWFRGLINNHNIDEKNVDQILQFYGAKRIFVGHTKNQTIHILFNQKVWGMDVPFYLYTGSPMESLLIENGDFFKLNTSGISKKITVL